MKPQVDMHMHSWYSDGSYSPEIMAMAATGLQAACLTDHDNVMGVAEFLDTAQKIGIDTMPAFEGSTLFHGVEVHIGGYDINYQNQVFQKKLLEVTDMRHRRAERILTLTMKLLDLPQVDFKEVVRESDSHGPYFGAWWSRDYLLKEHGISYQVSKQLTSRGGRAYVPYEEECLMQPTELIEFIKYYGGEACLMHPGEALRRLVRLTNSEQRGRTKFYTLLRQLVEAGLIAMEVFSPKHNIEETTEFFDIAKRFNLIMTAGSDNHGRFTSKVPIGREGMSYDDFKRFREKIHS